MVASHSYTRTRSKILDVEGRVSRLLLECLLLLRVDCVTNCHHSTEQMKTCLSYASSNRANVDLKNSHKSSENYCLLLSYQSNLK
jgi:hypothetical protein